MTRKSVQFQGVVCTDLTVTIANGQTVSDGVQTGGANLVAIDIPVGFDGTGMTFQVSSDGINYKAYKRMVDGVAVTAVVGANAAYAAGFFDFGGYEYVKLVSTTSQTGDIIITLKTRPL